jgi:hypothetical protein
MIGIRGTNDGDDNNADDENEPSEIRGKKKKANRGALMRVAWYFCIIPRLKDGLQHERRPNPCVGMTKAELKKDGKFRYPADAAQ